MEKSLPAIRTMISRLESMSTVRQLRLVELFFLIILAIVIFSNNVPLSTDGATYTEWYRTLGGDSTKPCAGFEIGFCAVAYAFDIIRLPPQYFLKVWSLFIYVACYLGVSRLTRSHPTKIFLPALFIFLSLFVYLPLSITEHLTRQYAAGSLVVLGLSSKKPLHLLLYIVLAASIHSFALMFAPVALALWSRTTTIFLLISLAAAVYFSTVGSVVDVASAFFAQVGWYGEMLHNEFLKSAAFRFNLYVPGFTNSFGYPETSFRGILISFTVLFVLSVRYREGAFIYTGVVSLFAFMLWVVFCSNDLFGHRIYHYIREFAIVPTCCSVFVMLRSSYNWLVDKYRDVGRLDSP